MNIYTKQFVFGSNNERMWKNTKSISAYSKTVESNNFLKECYLTDFLELNKMNSINEFGQSS